MEAKAAGPEPFGLGVIFAVDQAHRLAYHIAVEPADSVLGTISAAEDNEIGICPPGRFSWAMSIR